ncbi:hypothetical protein ACGF4C_25550 [Streptomyces sp. NPDC048197]|uniref:hypothetical protein n=1 Tax=Streptomyces sp. NPDC048197 TaxID=3365511 RepID=UPI00371AC842
MLDDRLIDALVAHGRGEHIAHRVQAHFDAGADHVSLHLVTAPPGAPPVGQWEQLRLQWEQLAGYLPG